MITIITDSSAYLEKAEADKLSVKVVPINYTVNHQTYYETYADKNGEFEELLKRNSKFSTSQPNPSAFLSCFEEELSENNEILCITISSRLSGIYSAAYMAAKQTENPNIAVFDSRHTAGALYLIIKKARKLIDSGLSLGETVKQLTKIRDEITSVFSVDDMNPLRNSGRIGFVRMGVGTILNIKPILLCQDGVVVSDGMVHGNTELIKRFVRKIRSNVSEIVINYIENSRIATNLYSVINSKYPDVHIKLQKTGPVLGIHLGLGMVAVSYITQETNKL